MDYRGRRLPTALLLGTAFLTGVAIGPASGLIARQFAANLGINAALAQDTDGPIPTGYSLFLVMCSSGRVVNTSIQSPTGTLLTMPSTAC
jgi:hypothetical protein